VLLLTHPVYSEIHYYCSTFLGLWLTCTDLLLLSLSLVEQLPVLAGCLQELAQNKHLQETNFPDRKFQPDTNADQMN
jgi:hypothetical protein